MPYKDKNKQREFQHKHYLKNKSLVIQRTVNIRLLKKLMVQHHKKNSGCCQCSETDVRCLDFHHLVPNTKDDTIAQAARDWGINRLVEEMNKCVVMCSNCHRKLHHEQEIRTTNNTRRTRNREFVNEVKKQNPCLCGEKELCCLEFHHTDPSEKEIDISTAIMDRGIKKLKAEIAKCVVICRNCHRKLHGVLA